MRWAIFETPSLPVWHPEVSSHICDIPLSKLILQEFLLLIQTVSTFSMGTSVWRRRDRGIWKRGKEVKAEKYLISVCWSFSLSISAGFLPEDHTASQKAQQHFSISPAVYLWHRGTAVTLAYLLAIHVRGDPTGCPSWQLPFRNRGSLNNRSQQMQQLLSTSEIKPLAFKSL